MNKGFPEQPHDYSQVSSAPQQPQSLLQKNSEEICNSKFLHLLYWVAMLFLLWNVIELTSDEKDLQVWLGQAKAREKESQRKVLDLQQQLQRSNEMMRRSEEELRSNLRGNEVKATYIHEMSMEQHYLNKIENMQQLAKTQKLLLEEDKIKTSYLLGMNNFKLVHENIHIKREIDQLLRREYDRLSKLHDFTLPEKPFCIVVPTLNNGKDFRYQYNLRSIFNQNYTNYKVVIIDDASTDQNYELISQYIQENPVAQQVHLIKNKERMTAIPNIYKAATEYCSPHDILALVDGDDELLGINVFKVFNSVYTLKELEVMYSNIIVNDKNKYIKRGWSSPYSDVEKKYNKYREGDTRMFPLRTFNVSTFLKIRVSDLKDNEGNWFRSAYDQTICPQVLELSCGKNQYIDEYFYLYNFGLGNNDIEVDPNLNYGIMNQIRHRRKKYECPAS